MIISLAILVLALVLYIYLRRTKSRYSILKLGNRNYRLVDKNGKFVTSRISSKETARVIKGIMEDNEI